MTSSKINDFGHFLGKEKENEINSIVNLGKDFYLIHNLDILYQKSFEITIDKVELKIPAFLFGNVHREFYLAMCNFIRMHSSISFRNLRCAIDSLFTAYYLSKYPKAREVYLSNLKSKPNEEWKKIFKNIKATIKNNPGEFPLAKKLIQMHESCSIFAHSDAQDVLTRYVENKEKLCLGATYCDYKENSDDYKKRLGKLLDAFFRIFFVFWTEMFKKCANEELLEEINIRIVAYKKYLEDFQ